MDATPEPAKGRQGSPEQFPSGNYTRSRTPSQGPPSTAPGTFEGHLDDGHGATPKSELINHSSRSTKASRSGGQIKSRIRPPLYQMKFPPSHDRAMPQSKGMSGETIQRRISTPIVTRKESNRRYSVTVDTPRPDLSDHSHGQQLNTALPIDTSAKSDFTILRNTNMMRQATLQDYGARRLAAIDVSRHEKEDRNAKTVSGTGSQGVMNSTSTFTGKHPQTVLRDLGTPLPPYTAESASVTPKDSGSGESASAQSSGMVGEIWMDTLSLREWLHAYLTGEIGRATRAQTRLPD
jgi:hypothetical protein